MRTRYLSPVHRVARVQPCSLFMNHFKLRLLLVLILVFVDDRVSIIASFLPFSWVCGIMWARTPRVYIPPGVIHLARETCLRVIVLCLEKRCARFVRQLLIAVQIEVHLLELLVSHNINGFLSALQVEFKLTIFVIQFQTLWERSHQGASLFWQVVSPSLDHWGARRTLVSDEWTICRLWLFLIISYTGTCLCRRHLIK